VIVIVAWAIAAGIAIVVAAFCGYELRWKLTRLRSDLAELERTRAQLDRLRGDLASAAARAATLTTRP
jgi:uncharacterized membrane-anchored protein YhcB (DUF1043 family)